MVTLVKVAEGERCAPSFALMPSAAGALLMGSSMQLPTRAVQYICVLMHNVQLYTPFLHCLNMYRVQPYIVLKLDGQCTIYGSAYQKPNVLHNPGNSVALSSLSCQSMER